MIPANIAREHILQAIRELKALGYNSRFDSKKFDLLHEGERFPPKHILRVANRFANGAELHGFSGGNEANDFLKKRGFKIVRKETF